MSSSDKLKIPLQEIIKATGKFSEENIIGRGGYGYVYRGQSEIHGMLAIKRLIVGPQGHGDHEYGTEVELLSKYKHENLVSLIGYCGEGRERILVYKYEANGSLDKVLQSSDLSWMCRLQICLDAALGLTYLHNASGSGHGVIHRDIKSSNILLDENWKAKISDFGLSKLTLSKSADSLIFTVACGTAGYIDPEYFRECILTQKSDVYSFGVVLFEVLFGKLVGDPSYGGFTTKIAKKHYETKTLDNMIHTGLKDQMNPDSLSTFSSIAYECLNDLRKDRPTMGSVVEALEKALSYQQVRHRSESYGLSSSEFMYDVYISFRVEAPTTYIFDDLCDALEREGLSTCKDNMSYSRNESGLLSAIRKSRSFIILFSKKFAANSWNLEEVAEIVKCVKERGDVIIPVYSDVYPSEVREEKGYFGEAMSKYDTHPSMNAWRNALLEATNVSALEYSNFESYKHLAKEAAMRIKGKSKSTKPNVRIRVKRAARCEVKEKTHT